jgi:hypothetical protein
VRGIGVAREIGIEPPLMRDDEDAVFCDADVELERVDVHLLRPRKRRQRILREQPRPPRCASISNAMAGLASRTRQERSAKGRNDMVQPTIGLQTAQQRMKRSAIADKQTARNRGPFHRSPTCPGAATE